MMVDPETTPARLSRSSVSDPPQWQRPEENPRRDSAATATQLRNDLKAAFALAGGNFVRGLLCFYALAAVPVGIAISWMHGEWLWGVIGGVPTGMLISVLAQKHEERLARRVARNLLSRLARRGVQADPLTLATLEQMLKDRREPRRYHRLRRDAMWQVIAEVAGGYIELHEAAGLELGPARRLAKANLSHSSEDVSPQPDSPPRHPPRPVPWAAPGPFVPVGLACAHPHAHSHHLLHAFAPLVSLVRWVVACILGGGVVWAGSLYLPLASPVGRSAVAAGLGLLTCKAVLVVLGHGRRGA
jgi:hypothetical protein